MTPLSAGNARLKEIRKLARRAVRAERRQFLADGPKAVEGALSVPGCVVEVFATEAGAETYASLLGGIEPTLVDDRAMAGLSDAVTPAGVVALCGFLDVPVEKALEAAERSPATAERSPATAERSPATAERSPATAERSLRTPLVAICADVRDPGNAGTVIRCADAAGAASVVLAGDSVDLYNPKTVRASVGSAFHLPIAVERDPLAAVAAAKAAGLSVLAADMHGEADIFDADALLARPTAWLFGNEAWGLPPDLAAAADHVVSIPIFGRAESLNLSTAAALCLYASARAQRA